MKSDYKINGVITQFNMKPLNADEYMTLVMNEMLQVELQQQRAEQFEQTREHFVENLQKVVGGFNLDAEMEVELINLVYGNMACHYPRKQQFLM